MKIASTIARYLIAFVFIVFGLNGFLHFLPSTAVIRDGRASISRSCLRLTTCCLFLRCN